MPRRGNERDTECPRGHVDTVPTRQILCALDEHRIWSQLIGSERLAHDSWQLDLNLD